MFLFLTDETELKPLIDDPIDANTQYVQTDLDKKLKPRRKTNSILKSISHIMGLKSA